MLDGHKKGLLQLGECEVTPGRGPTRRPQQKKDGEFIGLKRTWLYQRKQPCLEQMLLFHSELSQEQVEALTVPTRRTQRSHLQCA